MKAIHPGHLVFFNGHCMHVGWGIQVDEGEEVSEAAIIIAICDYIKSCAQAPEHAAAEAAVQIIKRVKGDTQ